MKSLAGKILVMQPTRITGPRILACTAPKYRVENYRARSVFHAPRKSRFGRQIARVHRCANELEYHFVDPARPRLALIITSSH